MKTANYYIPDELWEQILLRQPVETLIRWKCVCKSWNRIISDKSFVKAYGLHQKTSENTRKYLLLDYDYSYYSAGLIDRKSYNVLGYYNDICCRDRSRYGLEVYGICDGLLCLAGRFYDICNDFPIFLYNPFIRKGKKLVPPRRAANYLCPVSLCFGFHDDDYKLVRVQSFWNLCEICIYSLNTDSWKSVKIEVNIEDEGNFRCIGILPYPKARLVNGVAYFIQHDIQGDRIISYDLDNEKTRKMQLPTDIGSVAHVIMEEYGESIALIGSTSQNINNGVDIGYDVAIDYGVAMWVLKQSDNSNVVFGWGE
ncbi:F-box/kelch-repeat protein At3g23880-like [Daucus carota subsp. sativus]|uniref:F-box/kelch-repeat protein At3g23880-like n=1 Tax=Daucus carota subsp. sativus TaxID=79200 RepID=UPI003083CBDE